MKLTTILKITAIILFFLWFINIFYLGYLTYTTQNSIQQKGNEFLTADRKQFNRQLYQKAYTIDDKLIKFLANKIFLINFPEWKKYIEIKNLDINKSYLLKMSQQYINYTQTKQRQLETCNDWFWDKSTKNKKNIKTQKKQLNYNSCIKFISNYKKKNSNISIPLINKLDILTVKNYNMLAKDGIWVIENIYTKYCNNKPIWIREINVDKNIKIQNLLCSDIMKTSDKNFHYEKLDLININLDRKIELFLNMFNKEITQHFKLKNLDIKKILLINSFIDKKDKNINKNDKIQKLIRKKELFVNCYNISFTPNILTDKELTWDIKNINIIKKYVSTNKNDNICIITHFNRQSLTFSKKIFTILTDKTINRDNINIKNFIYKSIISVLNI